MAEKFELIIDATKKAIEAHPNAQVLTTADGVVVAVCPLSDDLLMNGQYSYAGDIQRAVNAHEAMKEALEKIVVDWDGEPEDMAAAQEALSLAEGGGVMAYDYQEQRTKIFSEDGQRQFLEIRDRAKTLTDISGAVVMEKLFTTGDSWLSMACVDRLVEIGELIEVPNPISRAGQHRIFMDARP